MYINENIFYLVIVFVIVVYTMFFYKKQSGEKQIKYEYINHNGI